MADIVAKFGAVQPETQVSAEDALEQSLCHEVDPRLSNNAPDFSNGYCGEFAGLLPEARPDCNRLQWR